MGLLAGREGTGKARTLEETLTDKQQCFYRRTRAEYFFPKTRVKGCTLLAEPHPQRPLTLWERNLEPERY